VEPETPAATQESAESEAPGEPETAQPESSEAETPKKSSGRRRSRSSSASKSIEVDVDKYRSMKKSEVWEIVEAKQEEQKTFQADLKARKAKYNAARKLRLKEFEAAKAKILERKQAYNMTKASIDAMKAIAKKKKNDIGKLKRIVYKR